MFYVRHVSPCSQTVQQQQDLYSCPSVPCDWTAPPVVTRGVVEPSELNGKHISLPHRCLNLTGRDHYRRKQLSAWINSRADEGENITPCIEKPPPTTKKQRRDSASLASATEERDAMTWEEINPTYFHFYLLPYGAIFQFAKTELNRDLFTVVGQLLPMKMRMICR